MDRRRVVISGLGSICPLGLNVDKIWEALLAGRSGIREISRFEVRDFPIKIAGEIRGFNPESYIDRHQIKRMDLFIQYACAAADMAVRDAGLTKEEIMGPLTAVVVASGMGGIPAIEETCRSVMEKGHRRISPFFIPMIIPNLASGTVSIAWGAAGPNTCPSTACAAGAHAVGEAVNYIRYGVSDMAIAGGAEAVISPLSIGGFHAMRALSRRNENPSQASRPFDRDRDGFVMSEGAGIVILEEANRAIKRGARIYAEVVGFALNSDAFHITNPSQTGEGASRCMQAALRDAEISPDQIDYINAHGTSTNVGDINESKAIKAVFKDAKKVPVSSTKSMTGHLLGAAGGLETIIVSKTVSTNLIPPTINLDNPDPQCDLDYVPWKYREKKVEYAMSNSFGFGGTNACLIVKKWRG